MKVVIDKVLLEQGKTKYWLAKQTGITHANISNLCNNKTTSIKFQMIDNICNVLNCKPNDIFVIEPPVHDSKNKS